MNPSLSRVVAGLALASGAAVLFAPRALAVGGGLLLAFVLPGMALLGVLFRRRALTAVERTVLTPALSMGVLIVAGLGIHVAGVRIDRLSWTVTTVVGTLLAVVTARLLPRRRVRTVRTPDAPPRPVGGTPARISTGGDTVRLVPDGTAHRLVPDGTAEGDTVLMSIAPVLPADAELRASGGDQAGRRRLLRQFLPLVLVALVLTGAGWLSFDTSRAIHDTAVTALSATPSGPVDTAGNRTVRVSASGLLAADGPYTIRVTGPTGTTTVERTVTVTGDGTWSRTLRLPAAQRLTVNLYRSGDATAYRTLFVSAVD